MSSLARVPQTPEEGGSAGAADLSWLVEIPEEIWHTCICTHLDSVTLSRLARTCVALHRHTTAYCGTILYGRRLVREGLHNLRDILIGFHAKCYTTRRGDCARGELDAKIDGHIHCLCENFNSARGGDKTPGGASAEARQKKTAVHDLHKALAGWSIEDIATFLLPLATHTGMDWKESSAAISWALRVLGYDTLHRVLYSPDPVLELQNNDNTSDQEAIASIVGAVVSRCGSGDDGLDTILAKALALIHGYEVKKGVKDLSSLEFALAGGGSPSRTTSNNTRRIWVGFREKASPGDTPTSAQSTEVLTWIIPKDGSFLGGPGPPPGISTGISTPRCPPQCYSGGWVFSATRTIRHPFYHLRAPPPPTNPSTFSIYDWVHM